MKLKSPLTQLQEVLYELLKNDSITVRQMIFDTGILNIKARIHDLRLKYNLEIETEMVKHKNKIWAEMCFWPMEINR